MMQSIRFKINYGHVTLSCQNTHHKIKAVLNNGEYFCAWFGGFIKIDEVTKDMRRCKLAGIVAYSADGDGFWDFVPLPKSSLLLGVYFRHELYVVLQWNFPVIVTFDFENPSPESPSSENSSPENMALENTSVENIVPINLALD